MTKESTTDVLDILEKVKEGHKNLKMEDLLMALVVTNQNVTSQIDIINQKVTSLSIKVEEILQSARATDDKLIILHKDFQILEHRMNSRDIVVNDLITTVNGLEARIEELNNLKHQGIGMYKLISFISLIIGLILSVITFGGFFTKPDEQTTHPQQENESWP